MKIIVSKYKFVFLILFKFIYIPVMVIALGKVQYSLTAPGFNDEVGDFIELPNSYEMEGSFHTTSVIVVEEITYLQKLLGDQDYRIDIDPHPSYYSSIDIDDLKILGSIQKDESIQNSLIVGATNAGFTMEYETYATVYLYFNYLEENTLELGDKIISVNGNPDYYSERQNTACDAQMDFVINRDGEVLEFTVFKKEEYNCSIGIYVKDFTELIESEVEYEIIDTNTGGSSGGLMQALYIYNRLTEEDITYGKKIAGTGTIAIDGSVGAIGGIEQKILTAHYNDIDIFFVPYLSDSENDNYIKALEIYNKLDSKMDLVPVQTFQDALLYLESLGDLNE